MHVAAPAVAAGHSHGSTSSAGSSVHGASSNGTVSSVPSGTQRTVRLREADDGFVEVVPTSSGQISSSVNGVGGASVLVLGIDADSPARLPQLDDNVDVDDMDDDDFCDAVEQLQPVPVQQLPNPGESYIFVKPQGKDGAGTSNYFYDDNVLSQTTYFDSLSPIAPRATAVATAAMTSSTMPPLDPMLRSISPVGGASSMEGIASSSSLNALGLEAPPKVQWAVPPSPTPSNASVSTMESIVMDRGFTNTDGENNCFLNGVLQLLWHNDKFRQHVQRTEHRNCIGRDQMCVFCQLKNLFVQLKFTSEDSIPPIAIRTALSILYKSESRFQLRQMDDATECFDAIMTQLHQDQAEETASNRLRRDQFAALRASGDWEARMREHDCDPTCAAHHVFGIQILEQSTCSKCKATSEPRSVSPFVQFVNVRQLLDLSQRYKSHRVEASFGQLLCEASSQELWKCEGCSQMNQNQMRVLLKAPKVLTLGLIWDTATPSRFDIQMFSGMVQSHLDLRSMFQQTMDDHLPRDHMMVLRGMVCFYGRHYVAFQFSNRTKQWMMFDDTTVKTVGSIDGVWSKCIAGLYMPSLLLYEVL